MTTAIAIYCIGMLFTLGFVLNLPDDPNDNDSGIVIFAIHFFCVVALWPVTLGIQVSEYMLHGRKLPDSEERNEPGA